MHTTQGRKGWLKWPAGILAAAVVSGAAFAAPGDKFNFSQVFDAARAGVAASGLQAAALSGDINDALNAVRNQKPAGNPFDEEAAKAALDENQIGLAARFVAIEPGIFLMGTPTDDSLERRHQVTLTRGYEMQATEVSQLQYFLVTGTNPSLFSHESDCGKEAHKVIAGIDVCVDNPVEQVSWNDAQRFIARLNAVQSDYVYRVPSEAEWEYAARANGGTIGGAWTYGNSGGKTHPVASQAANALGLYDMLGNVWEWTQDFYWAYPRSAVADPRGPSRGSYRAIRGGSWLDGPTAVYARSAFRVDDAPDAGLGPVGLRLVRSRR